MKMQNLLATECLDENFLDAQSCLLPMKGKIKLETLYGKDVFNLQVMKQRLPQNIYKEMEKVITQGEKLTENVANIVANAMKDWAIEHGATHFTHWFQPMTGCTAEKHDAFFYPDFGGTLVNKFSGKTLICGEPDASSFPSGGIRSTFEARGYTAWDPTVPAFLMKGKYGNTLHIPSIFYSYSGEALDRKIPLLRSIDALSKNVVRILSLFGETEVKFARSMVGAEQEYFLVDSKLAKLRPDLMLTGRTLLGAPSPKGQEMEDHYFGSIPKRVMDFMQDLEVRLFALGIPAHTRHNEVAPGQFELAPLYEESNIATDHNMLIMNILRATAEDHNFVCLLHEKPFAGVNGSGKHNNWSICDNLGNNLLDPGDTPLENAKFLVFLAAVLKAVHNYADTLRLGTIGAGNDHRLGANEAPPAILSVYLGELLTEVLESIIAGKNSLNSTKNGIEIGVSSLPVLPKDLSDRNRTSPFAFTGNKFEYRAVGSSQSIAPVNIAINSAVACALEDIAIEFENFMAKGKNINQALQELLPKIFKEHLPVVFNGNGYSLEWKVEAQKRGLLDLPDTVSALNRYHLDQVKNVFLRTHVLNERELLARQEILFETYIKTIAIESQVLINMIKEKVIPTVQKSQNNFGQLILNTKAILGEAELEQGQFEQIRRVYQSICNDVLVLEENLAKLHQMENTEEKAKFALEKLTILMQNCREHSDKLEQVIDHELWPLPKYAELLWVH